MNDEPHREHHRSSFIVHRCPYPVYVGRGILDDLASFVKPRGRVFIITSTALRERFGTRVAAAFDAPVLTFEEGETNKTLDTANAIVTQLLDHGAKRDSLAIVIGGGMVGDTAGFAAAIFLRGIDLVHVPTTLLAQVDSSLGGKVAVNHPKGKNLIGAFHPPRAVISDTSTLDSLPARELLSGIFEALKGGVLGDPSLFELFESRRDAVLGRDPATIDDLVEKAIRVKADVVTRDEKEADLRRLLNYGHTIGHGIEAALNYETLTHGEAVAWGMIAANAVAVRRGVLPESERRRINDAVRAYAPTPLPKLDPNAIFAATEHDKKNTGSARIMVLPERIGHCIVIEVTDDDVRYGISALM